MLAYRSVPAPHNRIDCVSLLGLLPPRLRPLFLLSSLVPQSPASIEERCALTFFSHSNENNGEDIVSHWFSRNPSRICNGFNPPA
jgi:hypothetical protein